MCWDEPMPISPGAKSWRPRYGTNSYGKKIKTFMPTGYRKLDQERVSRQSRLHHHHILLHSSAVWDMCCSGTACKIFTLAATLTTMIYTIIVWHFNASAENILASHFSQFENEQMVASIMHVPSSVFPKKVNNIDGHGSTRGARESGCIISEFSGDATQLTFPNCPLYAIPDGLVSFHSVTLLDFSNNRIASIPESLSSRESKLWPPNVQVIFMSNNSLTHCESTVFLYAKSLRVLSLKTNALTEFDARWLPSSLEQLILTDNSINRLMLPSNSLRKLMLTRNRLSSVPFTAAKATSLELVRLSQNQLTSIPDFVFQLSHLSWFAIASNPIISPAFCGKRPIFVSITELNIMKSAVGSGASGNVHLGTFQGKRVAVKLFKSDSADGTFEDEIAAASCTNHPNITRVLAIVKGHHSGLVMELLESPFLPLAAPPNVWVTLRCTYAPGVTFRVAKAVHLLQGMTDALQHLHNHKLMHGDFYAHNIFYNRETGEAKLSDFGAAWSYASLPMKHHPLVERLEVRAFGIFAQEIFIRTRFTVKEGPTRELIASIIHRCLLPTVYKRPSFAELATSLHKQL